MKEDNIQNSYKLQSTEEYILKYGYRYKYILKYEYGHGKILKHPISVG